MEILADGMAGLKRALEGDFEVLVLDWNVPSLEGVDICRQYKDAGGTAKVLFKSGSPVKLNAKEFALVEFFMRNPNQVFSANELLDSLWSEDSEVSTDTIRVYINRIRERIDIDKKNSVIKTMHASGYKFSPPSHS